MSEMNNNFQNEGRTHSSNKAFSFLYRTRLKVAKDNVTIVNLSLIFMLISLLVAPWLVILGALAALLLGYRFAISRNDANFTESFDKVVHQAANHVKSAVENISRKDSADMDEQQ